jgi:DNA repair/transcription protein MET18/MMS19
MRPTLTRQARSLIAEQSLRISALKLLAALPGMIRYDVLHPQKSSVIHGLEKALDDRRRAVRRAAVDAR